MSVAPEINKRFQRKPGNVQLSKILFIEVHDEPDFKGRTALMWAAVMENVDVELIQTLCRHGADLNQKYVK